MMSLSRRANPGANLGPLGIRKDATKIFQQKYQRIWNRSKAKLRAVQGLRCSSILLEEENEDYEASEEHVEEEKEINEAGEEHTKEDMEEKLPLSRNSLLDTSSMFSASRSNLFDPSSIVFTASELLRNSKNGENTSTVTQATNQKLQTPTFVEKKKRSQLPDSFSTSRSNLFDTLSNIPDASELRNRIKNEKGNRKFSRSFSSSRTNLFDPLSNIPDASGFRNRLKGDDSKKQRNNISRSFSSSRTNLFDSLSNSPDAWEMRNRLKSEYASTKESRQNSNFSGSFSSSKSNSFDPFSCIPDASRNRLKSHHVTTNVSSKSSKFSQSFSSSRTNLFDPLSRIPDASELRNILKGNVHISSNKNSIPAAVNFISQENPKFSSSRANLFVPESTRTSAVDLFASSAIGLVEDSHEEAKYQHDKNSHINRFNTSERLREVDSHDKTHNPSSNKSKETRKILMTKEIDIKYSGGLKDFASNDDIDDISTPYSDNTGNKKVISRTDSITQFLEIDLHRGKNTEVQNDTCENVLQRKKSIRGFGGLNGLVTSDEDDIISTQCNNDTSDSKTFARTNSITQFLEIDLQNTSVTQKKLVQRKGSIRNFELLNDGVSKDDNDTMSTSYADNTGGNNIFSRSDSVTQFLEMGMHRVNPVAAVRRGTCEKVVQRKKPIRIFEDLNSLESNEEEDEIGTRCNNETSGNNIFARTNSVTQFLEMDLENTSVSPSTIVQSKKSIRKYEYLNDSVSNDDNETISTTHTDNTGFKGIFSRSDSVTQFLEIDLQKERQVADIQNETSIAQRKKSTRQFQDLNSLVTNDDDGYNDSIGTHCTNDTSDSNKFARANSVTQFLEIDLRNNTGSQNADTSKETAEVVVQRKKFIMSGDLKDDISSSDENMICNLDALNDISKRGLHELQTMDLNENPNKSYWAIENKDISKVDDDEIHSKAPNCTNLKDVSVNGEERLVGAANEVGTYKNNLKQILHNVENFETKTKDTVTISCTVQSLPESFTCRNNEDSNLKSEKSVSLKNEEKEDINQPANMHENFGIIQLLNTGEDEAVDEEFGLSASEMQSLKNFVAHNESPSTVSKGTQVNQVQLCACGVKSISLIDLNEDTAFGANLEVREGTISKFFVPSTGKTKKRDKRFINSVTTSLGKTRSNNCFIPYEIRKAVVNRKNNVSSNSSSFEDLNHLQVAVSPYPPTKANSANGLHSPRQRHLLSSKR